MAKGKFEAGRNGRPATRSSNPYSVQNKPTLKSGQGSRRGGTFAAASAKSSKLWPILAAVGGVIVLVLGVFLIKNLIPGDSGRSGGEAAASVTTTQPEGLPRAELELKAQECQTHLHTTDVVFTLTAANDFGTDASQPVVRTLSPADTKADLDLERLAQDLDAGKGRTGLDCYQVDLAEYLTLDEAYLETFAAGLADALGSDFTETSVEVVSETEEVTNEEGEPETQKVQYLVVRKGVTGRSVTREAVLEQLEDVYRELARGAFPEEVSSPELRYTVTPPMEVSAEQLYSQYCLAPKDAALNEKTFEIVPEKAGFGFTQEELAPLLAQAQEGEEVRVRFHTLEAAVTAEVLNATLFQDVLGEAHTNHTNIADRTNNLKLACEAIDGTIILPGQVFSFNRIVGERTEAKGYKEATAYVSGGASKPEVGGGVCQVASSIYYAVLQADLTTVERAPHMYLVEYVPGGMDAAIYWGQLDYKFENSSPYPIKIEASVHDRQVHITILGTEWKDYTVQMTNKTVSTTPYEQVIKDVPNDGTYKEGEVITTPYTGYVIEAYRSRYDKDGNLIDTTLVSTSRYNKRDKVIAHIVREPQPTQPTQPTQPPTQPTQPPTQPTQPPTEPPTQPTEPPTEPPTQPTEPPTEPPTQPTEPPTEPPTDPPDNPPDEGGGDEEP